MEINNERTSEVTAGKGSAMLKGSAPSSGGGAAKAFDVYLISISRVCVDVCV